MELAIGTRRKALPYKTAPLGYDMADPRGAVRRTRGVRLIIRFLFCYRSDENGGMNRWDSC